MLDSLRREDFAAQLGTEFRLAASGVPEIGLQLAEARDITSNREAAGPKRAPFALLFRGPRSPILPQRIYPLVHPEMGRLEIFLVPIGEDASGVLYEAIFN